MQLIRHQRLNSRHPWLAGALVSAAIGSLLLPLSARAQEPARPIPNGPVRISAGIASRALIEHPNPVYPAEAKANHVQGVVILHGIISETGAVEQLSVISGPALLQSAALDAVKRWRYKPYLLNGQPTAVDTIINVNFTFANPPSQPPTAETATSPQ